MRFDQPLRTKAYLLVAIPLVLELLFVGGLLYMVNQVESELVAEQHARDVTDHLNKILRLLINDGVIGGMSSLSRHQQQAPANAAEVFSHDRHSTDDKIKAEAAIVRAMVSSLPEEAQLFDKMYASLSTGLDILRHTQDVLGQGDNLSSFRSMGKMRRSIEDISKVMEVLIVQESEKAEASQRASIQGRETIKIWLYVFVLGNLVLAAVLTFLFNKDTTDRLKILMDNSYLLASGKKLAAPIQGKDEIGQLDRTFHDMAQVLEEASRKERAIVENAIEVICSINAEGRFSAVNPACTNRWGYSPDDLVGARLSRIICPEDLDSTIEKMKKISLDRSSGSFENRVVKKDKSLADMEWTAQWSATEKALFCVVHDVTEKKQIDRLKADFVAMVSHDLRTPLTSVQGFLELLGAEAYGPLSEQGYDSLEMTEGNIKRLITLINDLLDIEKMESGMLELHLQPTDMTLIIKRSIEAVAGFAQKQGITVMMPDKQKQPVEADGDRLVQVIVNLLSNAIKFSPKGECIVVAAERKGTKMRVTILDRGRGVPASMRESIFERFKQVELNDERKKGGSGLGLAICKAIVERHGGSIGVEPGPEGKGSLFWFILPTAVASSAPEKVVQKAK